MSVEKGSDKKWPEAKDFSLLSALIPLNAKKITVPAYMVLLWHVESPTCSIVSMFVCLTSVIAFQEVRNRLFQCSRMVKQTRSKAKTQMHTQAKNIP